MTRVAGLPLALALGAGVLGLLSTSAQAQIQVPAPGSAQSLGTLIGGTAADVVVTGGTQRGKNLFHAFSRFDLNNGSVTFDGTGVAGVTGIYGRIHHQQSSSLSGLIQLKNWNAPNPELMLMNPFGFVVGSGFSTSGVTGFGLLGVDALAFQDPAGQVFAFDMGITAAQLGVGNPDWANADLVGSITDATYPDGQGGSPITVNGSMSIDELALIGSQLNINGSLYSDVLRLFAQSFTGMTYSDPANPFGTGSVGSLDRPNLAFNAYTAAAQAGGVAPASEFVATQAQLESPGGFSSCTAGNCPGAVVIGSSAIVRPMPGSSQGSLWLFGKQVVLGASGGANPLSDATLVGFNSMLGGAVYSDLINTVPAQTGSSSTSSSAPSAALVGEKASISDLLLEEALALSQSPPLVSAADISTTVSIESTSLESDGLGVVVAIDSSAGNADSQSSTATRSSVALNTGGTGIQAQSLSSSEASSSFKSAEVAISEQVALALGLQGLQEDMAPVTTADIQGFLQAAIAEVRLKNVNPVFEFSSKNYNPAVLHLRYLTPKESASAQDGKALLELILITAQGDTEGLRISLDKKLLASSLRGLYGDLSMQRPINIQGPQSPARWIYQQLFEELEPVLRDREVTTLLLSADQGLQAIPYAALHDGKKFLGERFGLALTPSLTLTPLSQPRLDGGLILALGASEFADLAPLPLVPAELQAVVNGKPSEVLLNQSFTPDALLNSAAESRFSRVHVATHAEFLPGGPAESRIYTGTGPLSLQAFRGLRDRRPDSTLDLISLSACRTALGDPDSELGFAGLALQAGARSAIGSLWYVDDVATSSFFVQVYRYLDAGVPKAEALQLTRKAFSRGLIRLDGDVIKGVDDEVLISGLDASQRNLASVGLSHPYFWAGIQLLGSPW